MSAKTIELREKIHELRAKQRKFSKWEMEAAKNIQDLIRSQAQIEDDIIALEVELAKIRGEESLAQKILARLGL